ncbi:MAG: DNA repair protein RadA [Actinomycetes bacterium]
MAKQSVGYACTACQAQVLRWAGRCPKCREFGTIEQVASASSGTGLKSRVTGTAPARAARPISQVAADTVPRRSTGIGEFDRVLGGGLIAGQVVLLAGEPGVGKSTLLLQVAHEYSLRSNGQTCLYVSGEESVEQLAVRARRIGAQASGILVADENDLQALLGHVEQHNPALLIVDSVQTIASSDVEGRAGGVAQVIEVTQALTRVAKSRGLPLLLVGQSTRENSVAGPRALEHLVDTVLTFEGDRQSSLRLLRSTKNRYGPADEVVCFEQQQDGLAEVRDPSELFRGHRDSPVPGTCVTVTIEGRRALLAEVQSLVVKAATPNPRRGVSGLDSSRVAMLTAVTQRCADLKLADQDVFVATVGGAKLSDPGVDLAVCLTIASATWGKPMPDDVLAIGEVALSGDIRPVPMIGQRIAEASRLGFRRILVPRGTSKAVREADPDVTITELAHVGAALSALHNLAGEVPGSN